MPNRTRETNRTKITLASFIVLCLVFNFVWPAVIDGVGSAEPVLISCAAGATVGQVVLLAIWAAMAWEPITRRLPRCLALLVCAWYAWIFGFRTLFATVPIETSLMAIVFAMLLFLIVAHPLWLIRWLSGRVIRSMDHDETALAQFRILELLIGITIIAVLLTIGQAALSGAGEVGRPTPRMLVEVGVVTIVFAGCAAAIGLPCVWSVLSHQPSPPALAGVVAAMLVGPPVVVAVMSSIAGGGFEPDAFGYVFMFALGVAGTTLIGLWIARTLGLRLLPVTRSEVDIELSQQSPNNREIDRSRIQD